jgi:hypothetical protein
VIKDFYIMIMISLAMIYTGNRSFELIYILVL